MDRIPALLPLLALAACIFPSSPPPAPVNRAPVVAWAEAGCTWDPYAYDWVWWFDAEVGDPDGLADVWEVYADVIDEWNGEIADSFLLESWGDGYWSTEWFQYQTWLDCRYGPYLVEFVAYDVYEAYDVYATYPYQG